RQLQAQAPGGQPATEELELRAEPPPELDDGAQIGPLLHLGHDLPAVLRLAEEAEAEEEGDDDADDDREHDESRPHRLGHRVEALRGEVAREDQPGRPEARAEDAVRRELSIAHAAAAGDERREGPDQADETPDQDRLAAVALEV